MLLMDTHSSQDTFRCFSHPESLVAAGGAVTLDGKTAAERRRETLAIQATLPPDLKICSSCRQVRR